MPTPLELKGELLSDPLALGYAAMGGRHNAVADLLNTKVYRGPVPLQEFASTCLQINLTGGVLAILEVPLGAEIAPGVPMDITTKGLLYQVMTLVQNDYRLQWADVDDPKFGPACDGLIALGIIDSAGKAALVALGSNRQSRAEIVWGFGTAVSAADVSEAYRS
jgi:hypothetical protein